MYFVIENAEMQVVLKTSIIFLSSSFYGDAVFFAYFGLFVIFGAVKLSDSSAVPVPRRGRGEE
jgi:hypothetical protein